jgi:hypothetical protein
MSPPSTERNSILGSAFSSNLKIDGYINDENLVEKVETWMPHPVLGDMSVESTYADYRDWGAVKFPRRMTQKWGGETVVVRKYSVHFVNRPISIT